MQDANYQPWEKHFDNFVTPLEEFIHKETTAGMLLIVCAVIAMFAANSVLYDHYAHILHTELAIGIAGVELRHTLHHWINDGLMALFFMVVGLEIKREVIVGELSDPKAALAPIIAALGGMVVPAVLFYAVNAGGSGAAGWGVPMATDIAFAVGILALLGARVPKSVLVFLVTLAIVDDLGAVMVIALFYAEQVYAQWLGVVGAVFALLVALNRFGIRRPLPYFLLGAVMWFAMLQSGVHATLAGVLTALAIPVKPKFNARRFAGHLAEISAKMKSNIDAFEAGSQDRQHSIIHDEHTRALLQSLEDGAQAVESPLQRLEHTMHKPVALLVIPLFALANAGIPIAWGQLGQVVAHPVALGVILGLTVGKLAGIAGLTYLALKLGWGSLPQGMNTRHLVGIGLIGGVGFTMSIFIAELGFAHSPEELTLAKTGVLFASVLVGVAGYLWLRFACGGAERTNSKAINKA